MQLAKAGTPAHEPAPLVGVTVARVAVVAVAVGVLRGALVGVGPETAPHAEADCPVPAIVVPSAISAPQTDQLVPAAGSSPQRPPLVLR